MAALRGMNFPQGEDMFPRAESMKEMGSPEMIEKLNRGPVGTLNIWPNGPMNMGKSLGQWFALSVVISLLGGYSASMAFDTSASGMDVFRMVFVVAFTGYGTGSVQNSIWKGVCWVVTGKFLIDGVLYGATTAAEFAWLWPAGA